MNVEIILPEYNNEEIQEQLDLLMQNHGYNQRVDWEQYRKNRRWRKKLKTDGGQT